MKVYIFLIGNIFKQSKNLKVEEENRLTYTANTFIYSFPLLFYVDGVILLPPFCTLLFHQILHLGDCSTSALKVLPRSF